jgi:hypothetical protein
VRGDGDVIWPVVLEHAKRGTLERTYEAGRVPAENFVSARWNANSAVWPVCRRMPHRHMLQRLGATRRRK